MNLKQRIAFVLGYVPAAMYDEACKLRAAAEEKITALEKQLKDKTTIGNFIAGRITEIINDSASKKESKEHQPVSLFDDALCTIDYCALCDPRVLRLAPKGKNVREDLTIILESMKGVQQCKMMSEDNSIGVLVEKDADPKEVAALIGNKLHDYFEE